MRYPVVGLLTALLWPLSAAAQERSLASDLQTCLVSASWETAARACNAVIEAGRETPGNLALAHLKRAGRLPEPDPDGRVSITVDIDRALADFTEAIRLDPTLVDAHAARARAWQAKREFDRAIADYDEALRLNAGSVDTQRTFQLFLARGRAWRDKGDLQRAIADFEDAIATKPGEYNRGIAIHERGMAFLAMRIFDLALDDLNKLIELRWDDRVSYAHRGWVHLLSGDLRKASDDFSASRGRMENLGSLMIALYGRGLARREMGDKAGGDADIAAASAIDPRLVPALAILGTGLLEGRADKARVAFDAAIRATPGRSALAWVLYGYGIMRIRNGDATRGNDDLAAARIVDPGSVEEILRLGLK